MKKQKRNTSNSIRFAKKIWAFVLAFTIVFGMVGCNKNGVKAYQGEDFSAGGANSG